MFINRHIVFRNGYYYYRMAVPNDLKHLIPFREIKQSLKTEDRKQAECNALTIESNVQKCFHVLRSGLYPEENLHQILDLILPKISRIASPAQMKLSQLMDWYIKQ